LTAVPVRANGTVTAEAVEPVRVIVTVVVVPSFTMVFDVERLNVGEL
jgi:hypothetical protein